MSQEWKGARTKYWSTLVACATMFAVTKCNDANAEDIEPVRQDHTSMYEVSVEQKPKLPQLNR